MKIIRAAPRNLRSAARAYVKGELTAKDKNVVAMVGSGRRRIRHRDRAKLAYQLAYTV